ncbi:hypothetical protein FOA52_004824 [Chlamydomonas sp. UWO 241]|nr:hypothetical protein FOA52_004824 [Chlamydomonas sp. UWO 241]
MALLLPLAASTKGSTSGSTTDSTPAPEVEGRSLRRRVKAATPAAVTAVKKGTITRGIGSPNFLPASLASQYLLFEDRACADDAAAASRHAALAAIIAPVSSMRFKCIGHDGAAGCQANVIDEFFAANCNITSVPKGRAGSSINVTGLNPAATRDAAQTWLFTLTGPLPIVGMCVVGDELVVHVRAPDVPGVLQAYLNTIALDVGLHDRGRTAPEDRCWPYGGRN